MPKNPTFNVVRYTLMIVVCLTLISIGTALNVQVLTTEGTKTGYAGVILLTGGATGLGYLTCYGVLVTAKAIRVRPEKTSAETVTADDVYHAVQKLFADKTAQAKILQIMREIMEAADRSEKPRAE